MIVIALIYVLMVVFGYALVPIAIFIGCALELLLGWRVKQFRRPAVVTTPAPPNSLFKPLNPNVIAVVTSTVWITLVWLYFYFDC